MAASQLPLSGGVDQNVIVKAPVSLIDHLPTPEFPIGAGDCIRGTIFIPENVSKHSSLQCIENNEYDKRFKLEIPRLKFTI